ncbi:MAG: hypothetical protein M1836_008179 [Candelina mexicana]|nr:MAG: hypothetical protein M1836_008179 [Candelina mexicana]
MDVDDSATSPTIPDGGFTAWLQCASSFALLLTSFGVINSFGAFQTFYQRILLPNETPSQIAWIGSLQAFLMISLGILAGPLYDHGYLRCLVAVGSVLVIFGMLMTGLCSSYWQLLLAQGLTVGLGSGLLFLPSIAVLPQYFERRRALATGIGSSGSAIGGICFPILFNQLQPLIGFRYATWLIALIMLVVLAIPLTTLRMRWQPTQVRGLFDSKAWKEAPYSLWACYLFVSLMGLYLPSFYIQLYGVRFMETNDAFYLLPVLNGGSFFGRLHIPLFIADKTGPLNLEIPLTATASILGFAWLAVERPVGLFMFSAVYGFFAGAITTLTAVIDAALCPSLDVVGVRMGMLLFPWALGLLVGEPIAGAILASSAEWRGLQLLTGAVLSTATALAVLVRWSKYGMKWGIKC